MDSKCSQLVTENGAADTERQTRRPIQDEEARAYLIAALESVSYVVLFNDETPINLISSILPHVLVKGADYKPEAIVGYKEVVENGGRVETIAFIDGYSTTAIENKIKNAQSS